MITIDGSFGEGGGQILRSSLALSLCTGQPFRIEKIRAGRDKPGLMRQHLTAVHAAEQISGATLDGGAVGSTTLTFTPGKIKPGEYRFAVGTAGSATLVLQTVLPALLTTAGPSTLTLEGGTHNPFAPPFDFLAKVFLPLVNRMGPRVEAVLERPGFYPAGGGKFSVAITPAAKLAGFSLTERGKPTHQVARAIVANLPRHIAEREAKIIARKLGWPDERIAIEEVRGSPGPGNIVMIELGYEHVTEVFTGFGERDRAAEAVADAAVQQCRRYIAHTAPVGEYLTDQLLLPLALAGSGEFRCRGLSRHATTHVELIRQFLEVPVQTNHGGNDGMVVTVG